MRRVIAALAVAVVLVEAASCGGERSSEAAATDGGDATDAAIEEGGDGFGGFGGSPATGGSGGIVDAASGGSAGAADASVDASTLCTDLYTKLCEYAFKCQPTLALFYGTVQECVAGSVIWCEHGLSLPGSSITKLLACAAALPDLSSCLYAYKGEWPPSECDKLGLLAPGSPCVSEWQCDGRCSMDLAGCGTCKAEGGAGDPCGSVIDCLDGYACVGSKCVKGALLGQSCSVTQPCYPALGCVAGVCQKSQGPGASCATSFDCDHWDYWLYCSNEICTPMVVRNLGEPCNPIGELCGGASQCFNGICTLPLAPGSACESIAQCATPAYFCIAGKCQLTDPAFCETG